MSGDAQARLVEALAHDHRRAEVTDRVRGMLDYAAKLTRDPSAIARGDLESLRAAGLAERELHDLCAIVSYFAFVNRIADGLGVELELRFAPDQSEA